jgi:hypothetical protein
VAALWPDLKGAETAAILHEAGILVREPYLLSCAELPVTADLNIRKVNKTLTGHVWRNDHAPAFLGIETFDHASYAALRGRMLRCHRPIGRLKIRLGKSSSRNLGAASSGMFLFARTAIARSRCRRLDNGMFVGVVVVAHCFIGGPSEGFPRSVWIGA